MWVQDNRFISTSHSVLQKFYVGVKTYFRQTSQLYQICTLHFTLNALSQEKTAKQQCPYPFCKIVNSWLDSRCTLAIHSANMLLQTSRRAFCCSPTKWISGSST